jgi:transposase-like protein
MALCPSCGSSRVRNGYRPAPLLLRVVGIRSLLCDNCNFQFRAFSPLPPRHAPRKSQRKADTFNPPPAVDLKQLKESLPKVRPAAPPAVKFDRTAVATVPPPEPPPEPRAPAPHPARHPHPPCPSCGAGETRRRRRHAWERLAFALSEARPYTCHSCNASFYASPGDQYE